MKNYKTLPNVSCEIIDNPDGTTDLLLDYDETFVEIVQKQLKLKKKPTKNQISKFTVDTLKESIIKIELAGLLDLVDGKFDVLSDIFNHNNEWKAKGFYKEFGGYSK